MMWKCDKCSSLFQYRYQYDRHLNKKIPCDSVNIDMACEYCEREFYSVYTKNRHVDKCKYNYNSKLAECYNKIATLKKELDNSKNLLLIQKDNEIVTLKTICTNLSNRPIHNNNNIRGNNNIINANVIKHEPYFHVYPLGKITADVVSNICVKNKKIGLKITTCLGKGDCVNAIGYIFKAIHMSSKYKEYHNISYVDDKFICLVENEGWVHKSWEYICEKLDFEIDNALRRNYDEMDYKSKKGKRALRAMEDLFKVELYTVKELQDAAKKCVLDNIPNNHNVKGMYSVESSQEDSDSESSYESDESDESYESEE